MSSWKTCFIITAATLSLNCLAQDPTTFQTSQRAAGQNVLGEQNPGRIRVNNRVLARINNKSISVVDLVKRMDMVFRSQYPQYVESPQARLQYYAMSWKNALRDTIDKELILADAEKMEMEIPPGDIRQEMEEYFGPNIMENLSQAGLSYEEAWDMLKTDALVRRTMMGRVNMKVMTKIGPKEVRNAYDNFVQSENTGNQWAYRVISIRSSDPFKGKDAAKAMHSKLQEGASLEEAQSFATADGVQIKLSELFTHDQKSISPAYKKELEKLDSGSFSKPVAQKSRNNDTIHRIFYLDQLICKTIPSLQEMEGQLRNKLLEEGMIAESEKYFNDLHDRFGLSDEVLSELIPEGFEPFSIN